MSGHTPGPWINDDGVVYGKESRIGFGNTSIDIFDANLWPKALTAEALANARLIAAAPDMYDLIERLGNAVTDMFEQMIRGKWTDEEDHDVFMNAKMIALKPLILEAIKLRAAIAKATGTAP